MKTRKKYNFRTTLFLLICLVSYIIFSYIYSPMIQAATSPWTQTTWDSVGTNTTNQYESLSNIDVSTSGQVSLSATSAWYSSSWAKRKKITINSGQITGTLENFPVLVSVTDTDLSAARADGYDFVFTSSNGTTQLDHEIESWTDGTGALVAWVKVPSAANGTEIYLYYGNSGQATTMEDPNSVWDTDYTMVLHMNDATTQSDSTSNGNNATVANGNLTEESAGKIGNGVLRGTGATGNYLHVTDTADLKPNYITISSWVNRTGNTGEYGPWHSLISKDYNANGTWGGAYYSYTMYVNDGEDGQARFQIAVGGGLNSLAGGVLENNTWYYLTSTYDGTNMKIYVNGVLTGTQEVPGVIDYNSNTTSNLSIFFGSDYTSDASDGMPGTIDELRISSTATTRDPNWIAAEYANQNNPATFYTFGNEETSASLLSNWGKRKLITLTADQISGTLTNFPVLVNLSSDASLAANANADGSDIVFMPASESWTTDSSAAKLSFEIENYNNATGELTAWVKIPSLAAASNTFYLYYGNSDQATSLGNSENVWTTYKMVQHMSSADSTNWLDATTNDYDGTTSGETTATTGKIGNAGSFDGDNDYIGNMNIGVPSSMTFSESAWIKTTTQNAGVILTNRIEENDLSLVLHVDRWADANENTGHAFFSIDGSGCLHSAEGTTDLSNNEWHHLVGVRSGSDFFIYVDGALEGTNSRSIGGCAGNPGSSASLWRISGEPPWDPANFNGNIDEVRVAETNLSSGWISTEYNNQSNPASFHTLSAAEDFTPTYPASGTLTSAIYDTEQSSNYGILSYTTDIAGDTTVKVRSSNAADMTGATAFSSCTAIVNGADASGDCVTDTDRYIQYQINLASDTTTTPIFTNISIAFTASNSAPTAPGNLTASTTDTTATLTFGAASVDANFDEYKIFYKEGSSGVTTSDSSFTIADDTDLDDVSYNSTTTTTISGLTPNTQYVANIWAYDLLELYTPAATEVVFYTASAVPSTPTLSDTQTSSVTVTIAGATNPSTTTYSIQEVGNENFVQANGTLGTTETWQTLAQWGTSSGVNGKIVVTGLSPNTAYAFKSRARNSADTPVETLYSDSALVTTTALSGDTFTAFISQTSTSKIVNKIIQEKIAKKVQEEKVKDIKQEVKIEERNDINKINTFISAPIDLTQFAEMGITSSNYLKAFEIETEEKIQFSEPVEISLKIDNCPKNKITILQIDKNGDQKWLPATCNDGSIKFWVKSL